MFGSKVNRSVDDIVAPIKRVVEELRAKATNNDAEVEQMRDHQTSLNARIQDREAEADRARKLADQYDLLT